MTIRKYIVNLLLLAFSIHLGAENVRVIENFDYNWLFGRYGLQADGSKIEEPAAVQDVSFNDSCWKQLDLPHDWAVEGPFRTDLEGFTGKLPWRGIGWYRKHFKVDKTDIGKRFYLDFDGAMAHAEVWLNGKKVGGHPYGYTSFRVDLTPQLSFEGENVVAVRLNTENIGSRWYPGAGIYRHVRLVKTSPVHVDHWGVFVTTPSISDVEAEALVHVQVRNHLSVPVKGHYSVSVYELYADNQTGRKVASSSHVRLDLPANATAQDSVSLRILSPKRWSLEATNRYLARVKVYDGKYLVDTYEVPFGFRTIQFTHDNGFLLNGKRVQIQGTCNHHDLGALGTAINMVALERQLKILKSFGCNALRTSHNIPAPELLELADKMGFLVMDEAFDCWREGKQSGDYGSLFDEWHEKDLKALVCRDRNHPSVILWSTGNEVSEQYHPELGIARHLTEVVHRYDKTRPVTFGASYPSKSAMNGTELQVKLNAMKKVTMILILLLCWTMYSFAEILPTTIRCEIEPVYKYRTDSLPGRVVSVFLKGKALKGKLRIDVATTNKRVEKNWYEVNATDSTKLEVLLPAFVPIDEKSSVTLTIHCSDRKYKQKLDVSPMRYWTVYLYNHAHVDVGYTNTHRNVEALHKNNVLEGMKLGTETKGHVDGARFVWNPEVTWPVERLWHNQPEMRDELIAAMKDGRLALDASYLNLNTSICLDEELFHVFKFSREMQCRSGQPIDVFQQFDIPGITWGLIPVMAQEGIKYVISWPNSDRGGNAHDDLDGKPFWWVGPDGESKVLFLQPGKYGNSRSMGKGEKTGRPWFGQRDQTKVPLRIQMGTANVDFTDRLVQLEKSGYPYDFMVLSWSLWDNCPLDADVPYAVQEWNKKYAYPQIRICGGHEIMFMIEEKYGKDLPVVKGDYTEYWTDGLGTAARLTAMNRNAKERVSQAETLWSMLADGHAAPRDEMDEAWRYIIWGSEHTWCFENPSEPFFQEAIWKVKQSYFQEAEDRSIMVLDEALAPVTDKSDGGLGPKDGPSNGGVAVFNTHTWNQDGIVTLSAKESSKGNRVIDENGNSVLSQRLSTGELVFFAKNVPALGSAHYRVVEGESVPLGSCAIHGTTLENEFLSVRIDGKTGNIVSVQKKGEQYDYIDASVDGGANSFSWLPANKDMPHADTVTAISVVENGPFVVELKIDSKAKGCRSVSRSVRLVSGLPWVEISNTVDKLPWEEKDGVHFGFGFNIPQATTKVDIPWGIMKVEKDQWKQGNRNWLTLQRWLDVSNETRGVTWCSLDAPLFEYGNRLANIALGWGGQGPWQKELSPSSTIYSWVMNNHWHTNFPTTQEGPVTFRYRLYPHDQFDVVSANRFGLEQAQPLVHVMANKNPCLSPVLAVDNKLVYATILKSTKNDRELVVRLRSLSDKEEQVTLTYPSKQPLRVSLCRLEEIPEKEVSGTLTMKPYGQMTLKIEFKQ